tara:strand:+ start:5385 stop:5675 length:291 start_codon:yes stop_codon:yes gene_type:complete
MQDYYWAILGFCAFLGWSLKILEKVIVARDSDPDSGIISYLKSAPYRTAISIIGTIVLIMALIGLDQMNYAMAISSGYVGESAGRFVQRVTENKMP